MPTKSGELTKKEMVKELAEIFGETQSLWNACPANKLRAIYVEVKTGHTAGVEFALEKLREEKQKRRERELSRIREKELINAVADAQQDLREIIDLHNKTMTGIIEVVDAIGNTKKIEAETQDDVNFFWNALNSIKKIATLGFF
jgi:uncharacterized protein (DUF3084 family)